MINALLPDNIVRPLPFYLAMEEFLAATGNDDYFFMWQVKPTVIIGRNQHILSEVNIDYCLQHGIDIIRRKSGGGCVYADMNNIMLSYITTSSAITSTFTRYTAMIADMLCRLGIKASVGGRNDIFIGERKVSGNAFYHKHGRAILHGTMLYDTDIDEMLHAITPSNQKLTSKGVESVRSHVINLSDVTDMLLEQFKNEAIRQLCDRSIQLTYNDINEIECIADTYCTHEWLYGNSPRATTASSHRIDGVGEFDITVSLKANRIENVSILGDFFLLSDIDTMLLDKLKGIEYTHDAIAKALEGIDVSTVIANLGNDLFINMMIQS